MPKAGTILSLPTAGWKGSGKSGPNPTFEIHPETAAAHGISDSDSILIQTKYGEIREVAKVTDIVHSRVVSSALGWWFPEGDAAEIQFQYAHLHRKTGEGILHPQFEEYPLQDQAVMSLQQPREVDANGGVTR